MSQPYDLHRALLRPAIIHILRAAGFHSTKPSVLDTLVNLAERYLMLLASTTATQARSSHNDPVPTITDIRMALAECGAISPVAGAAEEDWRERMRRPLSEIEKPENGGRARAQAEKRRREDEDLRDVREFARWFDSPQHAEMRRIAGLMPDAGTTAIVGVGGGVVQAEDFLTVLKRKHGKVGEDTRFQGTALGREGEDRAVVIEGGPVGSLRDWRPPVQPQTQKQVNGVDAPASKELDTLEADEDMQDASSSTLGHEDAAMEDASAAP